MSVSDTDSMSFDIIALFKNDERLLQKLRDKIQCYQYSIQQQQLYLFTQYYQYYNYWQHLPFNARMQRLVELQHFQSHSDACVKEVSLLLQDLRSTETTHRLFYDS